MIDRSFKIGKTSAEIALLLTWTPDTARSMPDVPMETLSSPAMPRFGASPLRYPPRQQATSQQEIVEGLAYLGRSSPRDGKSRSPRGPLDENLGDAQSWVNEHEWQNGNLVRRSQVVKRSPNRVSKAPPGVLIVHVKSASNLKNLEMLGTSDPYCKVKVAGEKLKTKTIENDLNPRWDETFRIPIYETPESEVLKPQNPKNE